MKKKILKQHCSDVLKELGSKGQLLWKGKKLTVDPFSKAHFTCEIISTDQKEFSISGMIEQGKKRFQLHLCDLVINGDTPCFIQDQFLTFFEEGIDWYWIKKLSKETLVISGNDWKKFHEDLLEEKIPVIWNGCDKQKQEILPILELMDDTGAFANLHFDGVDPVQEKEWEKDLLETDFIRKQVGYTQYYCPLNRVHESLGFLLDLGWKVVNKHQKRVILQTEALFDLDRDGEMVKLEGVVSFGEEERSFSDVVFAVLGNERFISLGDECVGLIDPTLLPKEISHLKKGESLEKRIEDIGLLLPFASFSLQTEIEPGKNFRGTLYPYQQEGLNWLGFLYNNKLHGILADEMGLGKTVQVLAFFSRIETNLPTLIIAPSSLIFNWHHELSHFLPEARVYLHIGAEREKNVTSLEREEVILTSFAILRQDQALFKELQFEMIVLDEAQAIKNAKSQLAKVVKTLKGNFRLSLSGTPIENRFEELLSQFEFLMPNLLRGESLERSKQKVRPFIKRRKKVDVEIDLPEKIEQTILIEMDEMQKDLYENYLSKSKENLQGLGIFEALLRLRQICCHPALLNEEGESQKLLRVMTDLKEVVADGSKVIIFSQFTSMLGLVQNEVEQERIPYLYLDGKTKNRGELISKFQNDLDIPLFLISLKAGGVGLNLTAADYVFIYDPWWNEAVENQAIDRAHRIGRKKSVIARRYVMTGTIEEKIMTLKQEKKALAAEFLEGQIPAEISMDELRSILFV